MLSVKNLTARIDGKDILTDLSLTFKKGATYAIMGPNGSGKSTLGRVLMGDPLIDLKRGSRITLGRDNITKDAPEERAAKGIFLSMQSPLEIPGVTVGQLLRAATKDRGLRPRELKKQIDTYATALNIPNDLLQRSLNEGFSGGERKKIEALQAAVLDPQYLILDEIDTGVDVDALKTIATFLKRHAADTGKTLIIITHYNRILRYIKPDTVLVIKDGTLAKKGDATLAKTIEQKGYN